MIETTSTFTATGGTTYYFQIGTAGTSTTGGRPTLRLQPDATVTTGRCCTAGVCSVVTACACNGGGGTYAGDGTTCATGACCNIAAGTCSTTDPCGCASPATFLGAGSTCAQCASDGCAGAQVVTNGAPAATGNNCSAGATDDAEALCQATSNKDVWYSYVATCNGAVNMTTEGSVQTDTVLSAYGSCGGAEIGCDDDAGTGLLSNMTFSVSLGTTYKVRLASFSTGCGVYNLNITCLPAVCGNNTVEPGEACDGTGPLGACVNGCTAGCQCAAPAIDDCANASTASDGVNLINRAFATTDGAAQPLPPCDFPFGDDQLHNDVWLNYTASCTGRLLVDTCNGAGLDTRLAVYGGCGCPAGADPLSCNDDSGATDELTDLDQDPDTCNQLGGSPFESATRNQVVAGTCYKIRVGSFAAGDATAGVDELFIQCITKGACCGAGGVCTEGQIPAECSGTFFVGADCEVESCCISNTCSLLAPECCQGLGGTPGGPGSGCNNCGNSIVDCGEQCDGGDCCTAQCTFVSGGTPCRATAGPCDLGEVCDGSSAECPTDGFSTGNLCRASAGDCDAPESCDGSGPACPADAFSSGNVCRPAAGDCDTSESCNGSGPGCPTDLFLSGNVCRPSAGPCDLAESCAGTGPSCPVDFIITSCVNGDGCCPAGCNGNTDSDCPPVAIPTVSEWGLGILTLIGLAAGTLLFRRRMAATH